MLTICHLNISSECVKTNQGRQHEHPTDAEKHQKGASKRLRTESQALKISVASIPARQKGCFRIDSQILKTPSTSTGASDANICNPGCKYLQPHLQTLSSQNSYVHLHRKEPSPTLTFMSWRPISRAHSGPNPEIPHPHRRTFGGILSQFLRSKA